MTTLAAHVVVLVYVISASCTMSCDIKPDYQQGVEPEQPLLLSCRLSPPATNAMWMKDGKKLPNASTVYPINVHGYKRTSTLKLSNISSTDSGQYQCKALMTNESCSTKINVFAPPRISKSEPMVEVFKGQREVLCCSLASGFPKPKFTWHFKGIAIQKAPWMWSPFVIAPEGCLNLEIIIPEMEGTYSCFANNSRGWDKFDRYLKVQENFPTVKAASKWYVTQVNTKLVLECIVSDISKTHNITWNHQGNLLVNHKEKYFEANSTIISYLTITNTTTAGPYSCGVKFLGKYYDDTMVVIVLEKGLPSVMLDYNDRSIAMGERFLLICRAKFPKFAENINYQWIKNDSIVKSNSRIKVSHDKINGELSYVLNIQHFTRHDEGNYTCMAISKIRNISASVCISLRQHPERVNKVGLNPLEVIVIVVTSCSFIGIGTAAIVRWYLRRRKTCHPAKGNGNYLYDTFLAYHNKDFGWVKSKLLPLLEKHSVKYSISIRDYEIGKAMIDNITDTVYQSRTMIAVLSRNFISSKKCRAELDVALYRIAETGDGSLIAIRVDTIKKDELPKALRNRTFLDYTDQEERKHWQRRLLKHLCRNHQETNLTSLL